MFKSLIRMLANPVGISHGALKRVLKNGSYLVLSSMCSRIWRSYGVNWKTILMAVVIVLALQGTSMAVQITATWTGGAGNWNVGGNWSGGVVPNNGMDTFNVLIDGGNIGTNSTVSLDMNATIDNLTIDALDSLGINNARSLTLVSGAGAGTITNNGSIALNATVSLTDLRMSGNVTMQGTGKFNLSNSLNNRILGVLSTDRLTNQAGHTIQGAGQIGADFMALTNQGTINANQTNSLTIDLTNTAGSAVNDGILKASNGGTLII